MSRGNRANHTTQAIGAWFDAGEVFFLGDIVANIPAALEGVSNEPPWLEVLRFWFTKDLVCFGCSDSSDYLLILLQKYVKALEGVSNEPPWMKCRRQLVLTRKNSPRVELYGLHLCADPGATALANRMMS
jgi:hypothetical protein